MTARIDWMPTRLARDFIETMRAATAFDAIGG
ncbi:hypothetical protein ACSSVZ_002229 [Amorphus sp. MBR-141]